MRLNQPYLTTMRDGRPFVILKAATSLDGRMAAAAGARTQLTSSAAARHAHYQRAQVDAIAIGSGTLLVDDPLSDGAARLPGAAARAGGFRPPIAHAFDGPPVLDARGGTGDNTDVPRSKALHS